MDAKDVAMILDKCIEFNGMEIVSSCPVDIRLKSGELIETNPVDCSIEDQWLRISEDTRRGEVYYYVDINSIEYIKAYVGEWC